MGMSMTGKRNRKRSSSLEKRVSERKTKYLKKKKNKNKIDWGLDKVGIFPCPEWKPIVIQCIKDCLGDYNVEIFMHRCLK